MRSYKKFINRRYQTPLFFLGLIPLLFLTGCQVQKKGAVLARFDGTVITDTEFNAKIQGLPKEFQRIMSRRKKDLLKEMIDEYFLVKEARRRRIMDEPDVKDLIHAARQKILIAKLVENEVDRKVVLDPGEAERYYEAHKEEFMTPLLLRASHILVKTEEEAKEIKALLGTGADFAEVARARSIDSNAARGGDLGFFQKGQLIPAFEEVAFKMKKGETSEIFKTPFGYHIMQLTDRTDPKIREFGSVKFLVEKQLLNEKRLKLYKEYVQKLKANAKIDIDEKALGSLPAAVPARSK